MTNDQLPDPQNSTICVDRPTSAQHKPDVSVVIPAFNAANTIGRQLEALSAQVFEGEFEVIVANNRSTDDTRTVVEHAVKLDPRIQLIDAHGRQGINHARNCGVQASVGAFILFCDADDVVDPNWLSGLVQMLDPDTGLVGGYLRRIDPYGEATISSGVTTSLWRFPFPAGANCGARRNVFEVVGMFNEEYIGGGDETEFFWRAQLGGFTLREAPSAIVNYAERATTIQMMRQRYFYGRAHPKLFRQFRAFGMPRSSGFRSLASQIKALLQIVSPVSGTTVRRNALGRLAIHAGRFTGSVAHRVIYL